MTTYIVSYDLREPGRDYSSLYDALKSEITWWHHLESTWLVVSNKSAADLRNKLAATMDDNDKVLVVNSGGYGAWKGIPESGSDWLKKHL